jgi:hypothetical protein
MFGVMEGTSQQILGTFVHVRYDDGQGGGPFVFNHALGSLVPQGVPSH